jgi:hypothetical protein
MIEANCVVLCRACHTTARASGGSLARRIHPWRSGDAVPDRKDRTDRGKLAVRPGWTFATIAGPRFASSAIDMAPTRTALLPAPFQVHHTWNRPTSTGADGGDPLGLCWRGRPRRGPTIKLRRIRMESMRGIVRLRINRRTERTHETCIQGGDLCLRLGCRSRRGCASACSLLRCAREHTRMRPHAKRSREFSAQLRSRPMPRAPRHTIATITVRRGAPHAAPFSQQQHRKLDPESSARHARFASAPVRQCRSRAVVSHAGRNH